MTDPDDDFPVDVASARAVAGALRASSPAAAGLVDEHEADHGEILPTLLLDLVGVWFRSALVAADHGDAEDARSAVAALADLWTIGDDGVQTVIVTGFLEALPHPDDADRHVVESLPPVLRAELRRMEEWRPT